MPLQPRPPLRVGSVEDHDEWQLHMHEDPLLSVTRIGEISPVWQILIVFGNFSRVNASTIWQNFDSNLAFLWYWSFIMVLNCQILNQKSSHLVTLLLLLLSKLTELIWSCEWVSLRFPISNGRLIRKIRLCLGECVRRSWAVWPDGKINCSIFGQWQQRKLAEQHNKFTNWDQKFVQC